MGQALKAFFKSDAGVYLISIIGAVMVFFLNYTVRVTRVNAEVKRQALKEDKKPIFIAWHDQLIIFPQALGLGTPASVLCSSHSDGRIIGYVIERLGYRAIWGSSNRQPVAGLRALAREVREARATVISPDGPRGPAHQLAPGPVSLAQLSGAPIIPVSWRGTAVWRAGGWDRMRFMKPLSRIFLVYGDPIFLERTRDTDTLEEQRLLVENALHEANKRAQDLLKAHQS